MCNEGLKFYNDGTVNCNVDGANYLFIRNEDAVDSVFIEDLYVYSEVDIAR